MDTIVFFSLLQVGAFDFHSFCFVFASNYDRAIWKQYLFADLRIESQYILVVAPDH